MSAAATKGGGGGKLPAGGGARGAQGGPHADATPAAARSVGATIDELFGRRGPLFSLSVVAVCVLCAAAAWRLQAGSGEAERRRGGGFAYKSTRVATLEDIERLEDIEEGIEDEDASDDTEEATE